MKKIEMIEKVGRELFKPYVGVDTPNYGTVKRFLEIAASAGCILEIDYNFEDTTWCNVVDTTSDENIAVFIWDGDINDLFDKVVYPTIKWRYSEWA